MVSEPAQSAPPSYVLDDSGHIVTIKLHLHSVFSTGSSEVVVLLQKLSSCVVVRAKRSTAWSKVFHAFCRHTGKCDDAFRCIYEGSSIPADTKFKHIIEDGQTAIDILVVPSLKGGKPVVYILPAAGTDLDRVKVQLALVPEWSISAVYPVVEVGHAKVGGRIDDVVESTVSAKSDGSLVELSSGLDLSYLFWEARTTGWIPSSPPLTPTITGFFNAGQMEETFVPSNPSLTKVNSLVLPFKQFLKHLNDSLKKLTVHTAVINDFITYWLPEFVAIHEKGLNICFRFLPQEAYEKAAPLNVEPAPEVVTRVFLLFRGVEKDWEAENKDEDVEWSKVVGVKAEAFDQTKFRVLEWRGMAC